MALGTPHSAAPCAAQHAAPVSISHTRSVSSNDPETARLPSSDSATLSTPPVCPFRVVHDAPWVLLAWCAMFMGCAYGKLKWETATFWAQLPPTQSP